MCLKLACCKRDSDWLYTRSKHKHAPNDKMWFSSSASPWTHRRENECSFTESFKTPSPLSSQELTKYKQLYQIQTCRHTDTSVETDNCIYSLRNAVGSKAFIMHTMSIRLTLKRNSVMVCKVKERIKYINIQRPWTASSFHLLFILRRAYVRLLQYACVHAEPDDRTRPGSSTCRDWGGCVSIPGCVFTLLFLLHQSKYIWKRRQHVHNHPTQSPTQDSLKGRERSRHRRAKRSRTFREGRIHDPSSDR